MKNNHNSDISHNAMRYYHDDIQMLVTVVSIDSWEIMCIVLIANQSVCLYVHPCERLFNGQLSVTNIFMLKHQRSFLIKNQMTALISYTVV